MSNEVPFAKYFFFDAKTKYAIFSGISKFGEYTRIA